MMKTIKGPAIYLAQFAGDAPPFDTFGAICEWAASLGFKGVQIPAWDLRMIDVVKAAESKSYCDDLKGVAAEPGVVFSFETKDSGTRWTYRMEPDGDGTIVTESREAWRDRPALARFFTKVLLGGLDEHETELRDGMAATLRRLRDVAESRA